MGSTVMLTGIGHLGGPLLDRLAMTDCVDRVIAVSRDADRGDARCNLARLSAVAGGRTALIEHRSADLARPDEVAEVIAAVAPDVIVHAASLQTWWLPDLFPAAARAELRRAGYGVWLPLHLALALSLMKAVRRAGYGGVVLNAAYPDVVNVVLGRVGLAPAAGLGNVDELVAKVRLGVAARVAVAPAELEVFLVAHHALQRHAFASSRPAGAADLADPRPAVPPFYLRVEHAGVDVTERGDAAGVLLQPCPLPGGPAWGGFSAAAGVAFIAALLSEEDSFGHSAGPAGLPGGYPVSIKDRGVELRRVPGLQHDQAITINQRSHRFDGIETIGEDGTVVFVEAASSAMRETLGHDCTALAPDDAALCAAELAARFNAYATRLGVDLDAARR